MASSHINPIENAESEDVVMFNGKPSPGLAKIAGFDRESGWDVKKGKGAKGSTLTLTTFPPCEGSITFYLWLTRHFDEWNEFRRQFIYDPTKKPVAALDIYHATLEEVDVTSVVCKKLGRRKSEGKGLYSITIEFIEFNPPPKKAAVSSPTGTNGSTKPGEAPILTEQEKQLAELRKQAFP